METAIIIIIVAIIAAFVVITITKSGKNDITQPEHTMSGNNHTPKFGEFSLVSLPTGSYGYIGEPIPSNRVEIMHIAIVSNNPITKDYEYDAEFSYSFGSETKNVHHHGRMLSNSEFSLKGKVYYGTTLTGAPAATIGYIENFKVQQL